MSQKRARLLRIALAVALAISCGRAVLAATPGTFTTKDGLVSFWAPRPPAARTPNLVPGEGDKQDRNTTYEVAAPNYLLTVTVLELNGRPTTGEEKRLLESMIDEKGPKFAADKDGGDIELRLGDLPGRQIKGTLGPARYATRQFIGVCRIYFFQAMYQPGDTASEALGRKFLESVAIRDLAAEQCTVATGPNSPAR